MTSIIAARTTEAPWTQISASASIFSTASSGPWRSAIVPSIGRDIRRPSSAMDWTRPSWYRWAAAARRCSIKTRENFGDRSKLELQIQLHSPRWKSRDGFAEINGRKNSDVRRIVLVIQHIKCVQAHRQCRTFLLPFHKQKVMLEIEIEIDQARPVHRVARKRGRQNGPVVVDAIVVVVRAGRNVNGLS